jgi:hypothetical protein
MQRILPKLPELAKKLSEVDRRLKKLEEQQDESNGGKNG